MWSGSAPVALVKLRHSHHICDLVGELTGIEDDSKEQRYEGICLPYCWAEIRRLEITICVTVKTRK